MSVDSEVPLTSAGVLNSKWKGVAMGALTILSLVLSVRGLSMDLPGIEPETSTIRAADGATPVMALTALDANDQTLTLRYKIINRSDRDIWICEGVGVAGEFGTLYSDVYVDADGRTLVIARRIEVPMQGEYVRPPDFEGRYVRVRPGQEQIQSLALSVPIKRYGFFTLAGPDIDYATRLLLKIGCFDKDIPTGEDTEHGVVPYRWAAPVSGNERYMEITVDGVFIKVISLMPGIQRPAGVTP
jgi:hypothetical protein